MLAGGIDLMDNNSFFSKLLTSENRCLQFYFYLTKKLKNFIFSY